MYWRVNCEGTIEANASQGVVVWFVATAKLDRAKPIKLAFGIIEGIEGCDSLTTVSSNSPPFPRENPLAK